MLKSLLAVAAVALIAAAPAGFSVCRVPLMQAASALRS